MEGWVHHSPGLPSGSGAGPVARAAPTGRAFRSQHQAALPAWLLLHRDKEHTLTELARRLDVPLITLQREAQRLFRTGLQQHRTVGRARLLRADVGNRAAAPPTTLLEMTYGPVTVIGEEFRLPTRSRS